MPAAVRSYLTTGLALMGAGFVTAAQITPPLQHAETRIVQAAVTLAAAVGNGQSCSGYNTDGCDPAAPQTYTPVVLDQSGNPANIAANIINAVASIPRAVVDAVNELSYALEITGNWWVYGPNNVLGSDPADPAKYTALTDLLIPFKPVSNAVGEQLSWWGKANLPMGAGCTATVGPLCKDLNSLLATMFLAPIWTLAAGYQFPTVINPVSEAEGTVGEEIPGSVGTATAWSGAYVKLNLFDPAIALFNYLIADPSVNTPKPVTGPEVTATMQRLGKALALDFYPFVQGSFLLKGWPYTVLTPLFKPFIKFICPDCDAENPGVLPKPTPASAATTLVSASAVADSTEVQAPATEAVADTPKDDAVQTPAASVGEPGSAKAKAAAVAVSAAVSEKPAAVDSATDTPATDTPATDTPATDTPATDTAEVAAPAKADLASKPTSTPRRGAQGSRTPASAAPAATADQGGAAAKTRVRAAASGE
jgi:hypothetical protein